VICAKEQTGYIILCGLYYGAVCILDYITLNGRMVGMNDEVKIMSKKAGLA
jgi:hypothetical protein